MFVDLTPEQRALQAELREYFSTLITPEEAASVQPALSASCRCVIPRDSRNARMRLPVVISPPLIVSPMILENKNVLNLS